MAQDSAALDAKRLADDKSAALKLLGHSTSSISKLLAKASNGQPHTLGRREPHSLLQVGLRLRFLSSHKPCLVGKLAGLGYRIPIGKLRKRTHIRKPHCMKTPVSKKILRQNAGPENLGTTPGGCLSWPLPRQFASSPGCKRVISTRDAARAWENRARGPQLNESLVLELEAATYPIRATSRPVSHCSRGSVQHAAGV